MKLTKALKLKNQLAGDVSELKDRLAKQNSRPSKQKFDYDNREVLTRLRAKLDELVKVSGITPGSPAEKVGLKADDVVIKVGEFEIKDLRGLSQALKQLKPDQKVGVADKVIAGVKAGAIFSDVFTVLKIAGIAALVAVGFALGSSSTTPFAFYQYWINVDDRDVGTYMRWFTLWSRDEIEALDAAVIDDPGARLAQRRDRGRVVPGDLGGQPGRERDRDRRADRGQHVDAPGQLAEGEERRGAREHATERLGVVLLAVRPGRGLREPRESLGSVKRRLKLKHRGNG